MHMAPAVCGYKDSKKSKNQRSKLSEVYGSNSPKVREIRD